jgi:membrane associated rhomboid family serine protease
MQFNSNQFNAPEVTKNLIIINVLFAIATELIHPEWKYLLGLHLIGTPDFRPWQIVTHMFIHFGWMHLLFNMVTLYMFGAKLEQSWGAKRFLNFYLICGLGSAVLSSAISYYQLQHGMLDALPLSAGASGAIFGLLVAFAMYWPDTELYIMLIPVPVKAKYAVIFFAFLELSLGIANFSWDNLGHWAHLGGALFGFILVKYWNKNNRSSFY